jgi:TorA maturation chaperone TorD
MLGGAGEFGATIDALAAAARGQSPDTVSREYHDLFIGVARGELVPYASYYRTGFLYDKPLGRLREEMSARGIEASETNPDPEDHIASLCEIMAGLITGAFGKPAVLAEQQAFFAAHLAPWAPRFFADLEKAEAADFYKHVARAGALFLTIESEAFTLAG